MAAKKEKSKKALAVRESQPTGLTMEQVMAHPEFMKVAAELREVKGLLVNLPEAIGRAVAEAGRASTVSGPVMPLQGAENLEFHPQRMVADGETLELEKPGTAGEKMKRKRFVLPKSVRYLPSGRSF